jgi:hypothetical protein
VIKKQHHPNHNHTANITIKNEIAKRNKKKAQDAVHLVLSYKLCAKT